MQNTTIDIRQYLFILRRRWIASTLVFLLVLAGGISYCLFWPKTYLATALVVVQPQKVPGKIVQSTVTTRIEERLQIITQQVLSRTRLIEIIDRFNLYPRLRGKVAPDDLAERMRKDITIKLTRKNYFTISFLYSDPKAVAAVTNALAAFYVDSNLRLREQDARGTARFLARELARKKARLAEWEAKITKFKQKHLHELPEAQDKNLMILDQLQKRIDALSYNMYLERGAINYQEQILAGITNEIQKLELKRAWLKKQGVGSGSGKEAGESDPTAIKKEIERLRVFYTDDHPDIQRLKRHLRRALALQKAKKAREAKIKKEGKQVLPEDLELGSLQESRRRTAERIKQSKERIKALEEEKRQVEAELAKFQRYVQNGPQVASALEELTRGYDVEKKAYDSLYAKAQEANMAANLERTQRGEQFEVVDPAQVPDAPYRPDVKKALPATVGLGLMLAVGLSFGLNYIDTSFTSISQVEQLSEFPVLVVVPPLITAEETYHRRRKLLLIGAVYSLVFLGEIALIGMLLTGRAYMLKSVFGKLISLFT